ncbi:MAG: hypothetical protein HY337_02400 [Gemmatimonadetes bacterium]|nr:hypothetical protein [Gemmatimonadota bacterium]
MSPLAVVASVLLLAAQEQDRGVLTRAEIRVAVDGAQATVDAEYTVIGAVALDFLALRVKGQAIEVVQAAMGLRPIALEDRRTAVVLRAYRPFDSATVRVRYNVTGRLARIPLFVPSAPTRPPSRGIRIVVTGLPGDRATATTLPRFEREADGTLAARPEHLPSVIALVADGDGLPIPLLSEWLIVAVTIGGTGAWVLRLARGRRPASQARA